MLTLLQKRTEILGRPGYRFFEASGTKIVAALNQVINLAVQAYYEKNRLSFPVFEKANLATGITLSSGASWSANGKIYNVSGASLPADLSRIKKLWIENDTNVVTPSSSTYDGDGTQGTGIPNDTSTALTANSVFHEMTGVGSTGSLLVFVGTTAAGTTTKLELIYAATLTALSADSDVIPVPDFDLLSTFDGLVNDYLRSIIGYDS